MSDHNIQEKQNLILDAAIECFFQYGVLKTSMDDIAKAARVSRSLIYFYYKNKDDVLLSLITKVLSEGYLRAQLALKSKLAPREKLYDVLDTWFFSSWVKVSESPHGQDIFNECYRLYPKFEQAHKKKSLEILNQIIKNENNAEVFWYACKGIEMGSTNATFLKKRMKTLIDVFVSYEEGEK